MLNPDYHNVPKNRGTNEPTYLPRLDEWNFAPIEGQSPEQLETAIQAFVEFYDRHIEEGSMEVKIPFRLTGRLADKPYVTKGEYITTNDIVKVERILHPFSQCMMAVHTKRGDMYYFRTILWSPEAAEQIKKRSKRMFHYELCVATEKQLRLRYRTYDI